MLEFQIVEVVFIISGATILFWYYPNLSKVLGSFTRPQGVDVTQSSKPTGSGIIFPLVLYFYIFANFQDLNLSSSSFLVMSSCFLMAVLGFIDDIYLLSSKLRLLFHVIFVCILVFIFLNDQFNEINFINFIYLAAILILGVWLLNSFNFIDGADGLLAVNSLMICLTLGIYSLIENEILVTAILFNFSLILLSFLFFNWHPSKIFMGDAGSLFLGSMSLVLILYFFSQDILKLATIFIIFSLILVETTCTLLVRIFRREDFLSGRHDLHAYQQLAKRPNGGSLPAKVSILITLFWIVPLGILSHIYADLWLGIVILDLMPLIFLSYFYGPYAAIRK